MTDDDFLPGWSCVYDQDGSELVEELLTNHGIEHEVVPVASLGKYSTPTIWVRDAEYDRSVELIEKMIHAFYNPPIAPWLCRCGERIEPQFDICWKCGKDKATST